MKVEKIKEELNKIISDYGLNETKLIVVPEINKNIKKYIPDYDSDKHPISIALNGRREDDSGVYDIFIKDIIGKEDINNFVQVMMLSGIDMAEKLRTSKMVAKHTILHEIRHILKKHKNVDLGLDDNIFPKYKEEVLINSWAYNELAEKYIKDKNEK